MTLKSILPLLALSLLGCDAASAPEASTMLHAFSVESSGAVTGTFSFTATGGVHSPTKTIEMPLATAPARFEIDEQSARITSLTIPLGELAISPSALPPSGLRFRNIVLNVAPSAAVRIDARLTDAVTLHSDAPVELAWEMQSTSGAFFPLAPVKIPGLALDVGLVQVDGQGQLTVDARCDGTCWGLPGIVDVSDVRLHFDAPASIVTH